MEKNKKYHYTYKITNLANNKIYYGKHSTNNISDKYAGSYGMALQYEIKKYGKKNFKFEIDKTFNTENEAYKYERKIVNEKFINRNDTYNAIIGGISNKKNINTINPKNFTIVKLSKMHHNALKIYAKKKGRTMKRFLQDYIDTFSPEINYKLKVDGNFVETEYDYSNWKTGFKMVKISPEAHAILKIYAKKKDKTMKLVLENLIITECTGNSTGIKLKVEKSKKHV